MIHEFDAIVHVIPDLNAFTSYTPYDGSDQFRVGDDKRLDIIHIGTTSLSTDLAYLLLTNVLHVLFIFKPLLIVSKLTSDSNVYVEFQICSYLIKD
jgi:hypothetical protein